MSQSEYSAPPESTVGLFGTGIACLVVAGALMAIGWNEDQAALRLVGVGLATLGSIITLVASVAAGVVIGLRISSERAAARAPESGSDSPAQA